MNRFTSVIPFLLLIACNSPLQDNARNAFPGTYIRFSQHEYGTEYDTLMISIQNQIANEYSIVRKWRYERVLDGEKLEPEYKQQVTTAIYDANKELLRDSQSGIVYTMDLGRDVLFAGRIEYEKVK